MASGCPQVVAHARAQLVAKAGPVGDGSSGSYRSCLRPLCFRPVIVWKCQRGQGFSDAARLRNARDASQRPGGVLITGSSEAAQLQHPSLPDLLGGGWWRSAPLLLPTPPPAVCPGFLRPSVQFWGLPKLPQRPESPTVSAKPGCHP